MTQLKEFLDDEFPFLSKISQQIVSNAFNGLFSDFFSIGFVDDFTFFDGDHSITKLSKLSHALYNYISNLNVKNKVPLSEDESSLRKNLCILLWYGVENGLKNVHILGALKDGLYSVQCYLLLASMKEAMEYEIYQVNILRRCLDLYMKITKIIGRKSSVGKIKLGKSRKSILSANVFPQEQIVFSEGEIEVLKSELKKSLHGLFIMMEEVSLAGSEENIQNICYIIKYLIKIDLSNEINVCRCRNIKNFRELIRFSDMGFSLLHSLCHSRHRALEILYPLVVMPRIMFATIDDDQFLPSSCHINSEMTSICNIFLNFLWERIKLCKDERKVIYCMLISACLKCPPRSEYRAKILKAVVCIIKCMSLDYNKQFIQDILVIGENSRAGLRAFAIEAIPLIFSEFDFNELNTQIDNNMESSYNQGITIKKEISSRCTTPITRESTTVIGDLELELLKLAVCGIEDKIGFVRQRALSVLPLFFKREILINQCNKILTDLFTEFREIELEKHRRKRRNHQWAAEAKRRSTTVIENDDSEIDGSEEEVDSPQPQKEKIQSMDRSESGSVERENTSGRDINGNFFPTSENIHPMGINMDNTQINVQIISDEAGIFERKRVFKVSDFPLLNRLLVRCDDTVAACKKNAIVALECLFPFLTNEEHVDAVVSQFCRSARDKGVSIRKQVSESVYNIILYLDKDHRYYQKMIITSMECILLQVVDREVSVQHNAAKLVNQMIFLPLVNRDTEHKVTWIILSLCEEVLTYQKILKQVVSFLVKDKLIDNKLIDSLDRLMGDLNDDSRCQSIWMLYSILSVFFYVNPSQASEKFLKIDKKYVINDSKICDYITNIISRGAKNLPGRTRKELIEKIESYIMSFIVSNNNIPSLYYCYGILLNGIGDEDEAGKALFAQKNKEIFRRAQKKMKLLMFEEYSGDLTNFDLSLFGSSSNTLEEDGEDIKLAKILGVIGELIDYEQSIICKDLFEMLELIMSSEICKKALKIHQEQTLSGTISSTHNGNSTQRSQLSTNRKITPLSIMEEFKTHHIKYPNISLTVRAQCVVILGKLCLVDEIFARDVIPVFMKELVICKEYIIRNNIIIVAHDLCRHHTSLVESYLNIFVACLSDDSVAVRIHALNCLTRLLKEGYLVWKGDIMFRFVSTLLDKVQRVKEYAEFYLVEILLPTTPDMFYANFIECIFYFNGVEHPSWVCYNEVKGFWDAGKFNKHRSLQGSSYQKDRLKLYSFMLKNMTQIQKAAITQKICIEVFEGIYRQSLDFYDINVQNMLVDSFQLLSSEDGKVRFNIPKNVEEGDGDDEEEENERRIETVYITAKEASKTALREIFIKEVMKYLLELKDFLYTSKNSRCSLEFLKYLLFLSNEFNYEFDKIIDDNKHLSAGIRYDIIRLKNKLDQENVI